jgi:phosphonopyruvate decarboxylase
MERVAVLREVIRLTDAVPVIFTTGHTCREAYEVGDRPNHFYMTGSMGMSAAIGLGLAWRAGVSTVVVDGDGSLLMNPSSLLLAGSLPRIRLVHVVVDNGSYASTGGQPTASAGVDIIRLALAAGYRTARHIERPVDLAGALAALLAEPDGPHLLRVPVQARAGTDAPRVGLTPTANMHRMRAWVTGLGGRS